MSAVLLIQFIFFDFVDVSICLALALTPFKDKINFGLRLWGLVGMFYFFVVVSRLLSWLGYVSTDMISVVRIVFYLVMFWLLIQSELPKLIFVMLVLLNYISFVVILLNYLSGVLFPYEYKLNPYSFKSGFLMAGLLLVGFPAVYWLMNQKIRPLVQSQENKKLWNYIWLVPGVFCIIFHYNVLENGGVAVFSSIWRNVAYAIIVNAGSFLVTYLIVKLIEESNSNLYLKNENYQLALQTLQYKNLKNHMEEARRARHDLRHNMTLIRSYLDHHNYDDMAEYIGKYFNTMPSDVSIIYCDNYALNAVIVYYKDIADKKQMDFQADIKCRQSLEVLDTDIVVLLGNLLENAFEACIRQTEGPRFIRLRIRYEGGGIIFALDNSYDGRIQNEGTGFLSSKDKHTGLGISSVQRIAEKYYGVAKFEFDDGIFSASVMLNQ